MKRFLILVSFIILLSFGWIYLGEKFKGDMDHVKEQVTSLFENGEFKEIAMGFLDNARLFFDQMEKEVESLPDLAKEDSVEKPKLFTPTEQSFSIHNIEIGAKKADVEATLGKPQRVSINEYGLNWLTYHQDYHNFVQVMYDEHDQVVALYTNQDLIASIKNIKLGSSKSSVREQLGEPTTRIRKGLVIYELQGDNDYDVFHMDGCYITIFYDIHENNTVTAIQMIDENLEEQKKDFYTKASDSLREGFELQMFDLTNTARVQHGLNPLVWDEKVRGTARKHSADMAEHNYFNHTNLKGESPFDRMLADQITFTVAGENLAYGQFSSIFAHEGLMNSMGHRQNILKKDFHYLGVGVAFNGESHPYYTQNYYTK
ncbi:CAP domain-containing protein [Robertmurraya andreesenii]|uniref:Uncharacterized protein YkwD n=1 Tax=Anoxybacillus andreesenii TaxID=1325932 RepID=A0ABT9V0V1_9BACL|nr:CAP domain-containing protein [Robertmurraya andreesenii]MDQ0154583.1 uncharacterized protein YkwD [Robertmurraya andreesenii]